jgi:outer membrane protein insertion porin family
LLNFRSISGPSALKGIKTSKVVPSFSYSDIDNPQRPHKGKSFFAGGEVAGLGGNVRDIRPIVEYKEFIPVNKGRNVLGFRVQGAFITGYAGEDPPPFERFYLGGDTDLRGFDVRTLSPVTFIPTTTTLNLLNPDGTPVPKDPRNPRAGNVAINVPVTQISFPGGDTSVVSNLEYRIPIAGPVAIAPFVDAGLDMISLPSQLKLAPDAITSLNTTKYGCVDVVLAGCTSQFVHFSGELNPLSGTNFKPRVSTGLELQVLAPIINQPFRIYYAVNPIRLDQVAGSPNLINRSMFPTGAAGDFTFRQAISAFQPNYLLREPFTTFRFTVSTTF